MGRLDLPDKLRDEDDFIVEVGKIITTDQEIVFEPEEQTTADDLEHMVAVWQERMHLTHWTIEFDWINPAEEQNHAEVSRNNPYDSARLRFNAGYSEWSRFFANHTVVHELMHLVTRDLEEAANALEDHVPAKVHALFDAHVTYELEGVVDRTAQIIVELAGPV